MSFTYLRKVGLSIKLMFIDSRREQDSPHRWMLTACWIQKPGQRSGASAQLLVQGQWPAGFTFCLSFVLRWHCLRPHCSFLCLWARVEQRHRLCPSHPPGCKSPVFQEVCFCFSSQDPAVSGGGGGRMYVCLPFPPPHTLFMIWTFITNWIFHCFFFLKPSPSFWLLLTTLCNYYIAFLYDEFLLTFMVILKKTLGM